MAKRVALSNFDYIAHIQRKDGTVIELEGTREFPTHNDVFVWLSKRALDEGGWLLSQHISESTKDASVGTCKDSVTKALPAPIAKATIPSVFSDTEVFGEFKRTYTGALAIRFRPRSES